MYLSEVFHIYPKMFLFIKLSNIWIKHTLKQMPKRKCMHFIGTLKSVNMC